MSRHGLTNFTLLIVMLIAPGRGWAAVDPCREDFNADLSIGVADAAMLRSCMTGPVTDNEDIECVKADFQRDHHIDLLDAAAQYNKFGPCHLCPAEWAKDFTCSSGVLGELRTMTTWDDGSGPSVFVGGSFSQAGCTPAQNVAKWDGASWSALDSGLNGWATATAVFDDASGQSLFVGGNFTAAGDVSANFIAKWDGDKWSPLGSGLNGQVNALAVYDDGNGTALYAAGAFNVAGGIVARNIARWDGATWSSLDSGVFDYLYALQVFDDGTGPALYAGGEFTAAGGIEAKRMAKWDGKSWTPLGQGLNGSVFSLAAFEVAGEQQLYAGGSFSTAGGSAANYIASWNGEQWSSVGNGFSKPVQALFAFATASESLLLAGGSGTPIEFGTVSGPSVSQWNGVAWSLLGHEPRRSGIVRALASMDRGNGPILLAGGAFDRFGGEDARGIMQWDGNAWSGTSLGMNGPAKSLVVFDDGDGTALFVGGYFTSVGGIKANGIAKWSGSSWSPLGGGVNGSVNAMVAHDEGGATTLCAGGYFSSADMVSAQSIACWDGKNWSPMADGLIGEVFALAVFDDGGGPALYAAGLFHTTGSGILVNRIAKWTGTEWSPLGDGLGPNWQLSGPVRSLIVHDDGTGEALYAGGYFYESGDIVVGSTAKWDGKAWSTVGGDSGGAPHAFTAFDDGSGQALYIAGSFPKVWKGIGGDPVARWNGTTWDRIAGGIYNDRNTQANALAVFDDGTGARLYAGGWFMAEPFGYNIAQWTGATWGSLSAGVNGEVLALAVFDDGSGPALYSGGRFTAAFNPLDVATYSSEPANYLVKWQRPLACDGTKTGK